MDSSDLHQQSHAEIQAENLALRQQLEAILREARNNELKIRRFEQLEHKLIATRSLLDLVRLLLGDYKSAFGIDCVALSLLDRDHEASRMLDAELGADGPIQGLHLLQSDAPLLALHADLKPWLGPFKASAHAELFRGQARAADVASLALLPLSRHGELIGSLHFGSVDEQRYEAQAGTALLERLAAIVSVCLDSTLNQERLKLAGLTDALTGVHNRRYFEHRCLIEIAQARRYRHDLACLFLDLDRFKAINDRYGHPAGDAVLRAVGHNIQTQLRAGDTIARFGGEEFVVLLPQAPALHAREIAERIRAGIAARPFSLPSGEVITASVSVGLAMLPTERIQTEAQELADQLVKSADQALYQAKAEGRNRVVFSSS
ncbi:sensor domain-containing diguanylate cyclase [Paucibacter sp. Y2R2-4]|uniref:GGDEF domain-containing protein n=1 Tax=Paucibacter sp. Y2R2-4 TaxID=2893553 RepID=UPI0021E4B82D|nr:sensor domain-containing diguanylate cyclase [Paucibacter sp. Y2R2-4]MCV2348855.1 sensor domain-containing diguanylate cyclase [Paucibacter sp. Y2R2-4]